jgi:hypothetical protein
MSTWHSMSKAKQSKAKHVGHRQADMICFALISDFNNEMNLRFIFACFLFFFNLIDDIVEFSSVASDPNLRIYCLKIMVFWLVVYK